MARVASVSSRSLALAAALLAVALAVSALAMTPSVRAGLPVCDVSGPSTAIMPGQPATVSGTGFTPSAALAITLTPPGGPGGVQSGTADSTGAFSFTFTPNVTGLWTVAISQVGGCSDSVGVVVTCTPVLTPQPGQHPVDQPVTVTGTGFEPSTPLQVSLQPPGNPGGVNSGTSNGSGQFVLTFTPNVVGIWTVTISQTNGCAGSTIITVGASAPTPTPTGAGLPDTAASDATQPTSVVLGSLLLWLVVLAVMAVRSRRST